MITPCFGASREQGRVRRGRMEQAVTRGIVRIRASASAAPYDANAHGLNQGPCPNSLRGPKDPDAPVAAARLKPMARHKAQNASSRFCVARPLKHRGLTASHRAGAKRAGLFRRKAGVRQASEILFQIFSSWLSPGLGSGFSFSIPYFAIRYMSVLRLISR